MHYLQQIITQKKKKNLLISDGFSLYSFISTQNYRSWFLKPRTVGTVFSSRISQNKITFFQCVSVIFLSLSLFVSFLFFFFLSLACETMSCYRARVITSIVGFVMNTEVKFLLGSVVELRNIVCSTCLWGARDKLMLTWIAPRLVHVILARGSLFCRPHAIFFFFFF